MGKKIAGVVLAGGRSSRMGKDKALLDYNGRPLVEHMIDLLLDAGVDTACVSGDFEGYPGIPDAAPHSGPVVAICDVIRTLKLYSGVLFVPVDMPLLTPGILRTLLAQGRSAHFRRYPFPFYIESPCLKKEASQSVKAFLLEQDVQPIDLPSEFKIHMTNTNTPEEWREVLRI